VLHTVRTGYPNTDVIKLVINGHHAQLFCHTIRVNAN